MVGGTVQVLGRGGVGVRRMKAGMTQVLWRGAWPLNVQIPGFLFFWGGGGEGGGGGRFFQFNCPAN